MCRDLRITFGSRFHVLFVMKLLSYIQCISCVHLGIARGVHAHIYLADCYMLVYHIMFLSPRVICYNVSSLHTVYSCVQLGIARRVHIHVYLEGCSILLCHDIQIIRFRGFGNEFHFPCTYGGWFFFPILGYIPEQVQYLATT